MTYVEKANEAVASGKKINLETAIGLAKEVAEEKGLDYVYLDEFGRSAVRIIGDVGPNCKNVHKQRDEDGNYKTDESGLPINVPGCLVGSMFAKVFPIDKVPAYGGAGSTNYELGSPFTDRAESFLIHVQGLQDAGTPWGKAIDQAARATETDQWVGTLPDGDV